MTLLEELRALPREARILFVGTFINRFGAFVHPFLVWYLTSRGYSSTMAGIAMGCYGVGHLGASLIGGYLADYIGRRHTIVLSMFGSAATMLAFATAERFGPICILAFLSGITAELYRPAASALLIDMTTKGRRVTAFAAYRLAVNAGFAIGPATAGLLAERSFTYLFVGDAITSVAYGFIAIAFLPIGSVNKTSSASWTPALRHAARDLPFLRILTASLLGSMVFMQFVSTLPLHVADLGFSPLKFGLLISFNAVLILLFELPLTHQLSRFSPTRVIGVGLAFTAMAWGLTGFATTMSFLLVHTLLWSIGEMVFAPVASSFVADLAPEDYRGRYMGLFAFTWSVGLTVGPSGGAFLYSINPSILWATCLGVGLIAAVVAYTTKPEDTELTI